MDSKQTPIPELQLFDVESAEQAATETVLDEQEQNKLSDQANILIDDLFKLSATDVRERQNYAREVENLGAAVQRKLVHKSNLLREPMQVLMADLQDGGSIAKDLLDLQHQINQINPNRFNFKMSGFRRLLSKLPGVGTVLSNWLVKFETVQSVINDLTESLKVGRQRLERDNVILENDKIEMLSLSAQLRKYVEYGRILDQQLTQRIETEISDEQRKEFLQKDVLFPLRQRVLDLQQQQAVNQHGVVTAEAIVQNNKELMRGVDRSLNVTVVAFQTASTLSIALEHQKRVLKGVQAINETTNDLLLKTSEKLKDQGAQIQQQSASASVDMQVLKQAFENVDAALKQVNEFRLKALPQLGQSIVEMGKINQEMESSIEEMKRSEEIAQRFELDV